MTDKIMGALVGWRREPTANGMMFVLQLARSAEDRDAHNFDVTIMTLNDRRLGSFARDLKRAAKERGVSLRPKWRRWFLF